MYVLLAFNDGRNGVGIVDHGSERFLVNRPLDACPPSRRRTAEGPAAVVPLSAGPFILTDHSRKMSGQTRESALQGDDRTSALDPKPTLAERRETIEAVHAHFTSGLIAFRVPRYTQ